MPTTRALVVDDAEEVAQLVADVLATAGYETRVTGSGADALSFAREWDPHVIILDLSLPDVDGIEVCRRLRTFSDAYILILSARSDEIDRIIGLSVGADDYLTKPFSSRELVARVNALMRRRRIEPPPDELADDRKRRFATLVVDCDVREVCCGDRVVDLTKIEFDILDALTEQPRRVMTRAQLRERVWGAGWFGEDHAVDVHVSNLRKKLADAGAPTVVTTVRGVGYRLSPELLSGSS